MAAFDKSLLLCALYVCCVPCVVARRSHHHHRGAGQSELFIFSEVCALKDEPGPCKALKHRYFFNIDSGRCETFEYGGCGGNQNNFLNLEDCEATCVVSEDKNPCHLPEAPGPCRGLVSRYMFDSDTHTCRHFFYGGCFGNANNFRSMELCERRCVNPDKTEKPTAAPEVHTQAVRRLEPVVTTVETGEMTVNGHVEALVQHNQTKGHFLKDPDESDVCSQTLQRGSCSGSERRFFYNSSSRRCQSFMFSGCGGNMNNFSHRRHCIRKCVIRDREHTGRPRKESGGTIRIRRKNLQQVASRSV